MSDYFTNRYFANAYFPAGYFGTGAAAGGNLVASISGAGNLAATLTATASGVALLTGMGDLSGTLTNGGTIAVNISANLSGVAYVGGTFLPSIDTHDLPTGITYLSPAVKKRLRRLHHYVGPDYAERAAEKLAGSIALRNDILEAAGLLPKPLPKQQKAKAELPAIAPQERDDELAIILLLAA